MLGFNKKRGAETAEEQRRHDDAQQVSPEFVPQRPWVETALPVFACGAGLFSDGYINNVRQPLRSESSFQ